MKNISHSFLASFLIFPASCRDKQRVPVPTIDGDWWQIAGHPDLGHTLHRVRQRDDDRYRMS